MSVKAIKLGVNIDHVATLRQARRASMPDVVEAAASAVRGGADGITVHLREDRRHIQDADVAALVPFYRVNLEMAATPEMVAVAAGCVGLPTPHSVCIVPEKRQELTTEGGLDVLSQRARLTDAVADLKAAGVVVSLFVAPDPWQIEAAARTGASHVELHTGAYAEAASMGAAIQRETELRALKKAATTALQMGLRVNAGHGLDYRNVGAILDLAGLEELNIGFAIVARAVFVGLEEAVREMKILIDVSAAPMAVNA